MPSGVGRTMKDGMILQKWREKDLAESGQSNIPDQGIVWDNQGRAREVSHREGAPHDQGHSMGPSQPPPRNPGGPGGPDDSDSEDSDDDTHNWDNGTPHNNERRKRPTGGNGPPLPPPPGGGGGGGGHDSSDDAGDEYQQAQSNSGMMSNRLSVLLCRRRNEEAYQWFHGVVHDRICQFINEHLTVQIRLPDGMKLPRLDIKSVKPYNGDLSMEVLWDWLKSLVIHLKTQQLGRPDRDRERKLIIEPILTGKAKNWYHDHVIEVDSDKTWTFTSVILALYD